MVISTTDIPEPKDSGSDGSQLKEIESKSAIQPPHVGQPLSNAIAGLAASNNRAFGGEVASTLIAGATSQMAVELEKTRQDLSDQRAKNEKLYSELSAERTKCAVLAERINSYRSTRHLKNLGVAIGSLLLGLGVQLIQTDSNTLCMASLIGGTLLILASWFSAPKGGDE